MSEQQPEQTSPADTPGSPSTEIPEDIFERHTGTGTEKIDSGGAQKEIDDASPVDEPLQGYLEGHTGTGSEKIDVGDKQ